MGSLQQAVLEFDLEVQAPWRPRLTVVPDLVQAVAIGAPAAAPVTAGAGARRPVRAVPTPQRQLSRRSPSRVAACAPGRADAPGPRRRSVSPSAGPTRGQGPTRGWLAPPAVAGRPARRLRLTRRAHLLVLVLALAGAMALGSWLASVAGDGTGDLRLVGDRTVVVRSGDTVWSIATSLGHDGDVRALVDDIQRINGLEGPGGAALHPGQELRLP